MFCMSDTHINAHAYTTDMYTKQRESRSLNVTLKYFIFSTFTHSLLLQELICPALFQPIHLQ